MAQLERIGVSLDKKLLSMFDKLIGEDNIFPARPGLAAAVEAAVEEAQKRISERSE